MGVTEDSEQLRRLARAVMVGELTRDEYRRQRRAIIDRHAGDVPMSAQPLSAVVEPAARAGEHTVPNTLTLPTVPYRQQADDITRIEPAARTRPAPALLVDPPADRPRQHGDLWIGVLVVAVVLICVGALLAFFW